MTEPMTNCWATTMGKRWQSNYELFEGMLAEIREFLLDCAALQPGEKVLDIGFGGGATALDVARVVGEEGLLVGVDISADLVELTRERAAQAGLANVRFVEADASAVELAEAPFDVLLSRFGVMFFEDPYAAFAHLHSLLRPGGRTAIIVWGPVEENVWMSSMREIVGKYVEMPPPDPKAPGPLAFSDFGYFADILEKAGFSEISRQEWRGPLYIGGKGSDPAAAAEFAMTTQSSAETIEELPEATKARIRAELIAMATPFYRDGSVTMPGAAYFVSATA